MPAPPNIRKKVLERDGHKCLKCGKRARVQAHHIYAADNHDLDNLATLCELCHREWHIVVEARSKVAFEQWVDIPSYNLLLSLFIAKYPDEMLFNDAITAIKRVSMMIKGIE